MLSGAMFESIFQKGSPSVDHNFRKLALWLPFVLLFTLLNIGTYSFFRTVRAVLMTESAWTKTQKNAVSSVLQYAVEPDERYLMRYDSLNTRLQAVALAREALKNRDLSYGQVMIYLNNLGSSEHAGQIYFFFRYGSTFEMVREVTRLWKKADSLASAIDIEAKALFLAKSRGAPTRVLNKIIQRIADLDRESSRVANLYALRLDRSLNNSEAILSYSLVVLSLLIFWAGSLTVKKISSRRLLRDSTFQLLVEDFPAIYLVLNAKREIMFINPFALKGFGLPDRDVIDKDVTTLFSSPQRKDLFRSYSDSLQNPGKTIPIFAELFLFNESNIWIRGSLKTVIREGEKIVLVLLQDVTKSELHARENQRLLSALESSTNEIYIFNSKTFKFEFFNQGALTNLGYSAEEMQELGLLDIKPNWSKDDVQIIMAKLIQSKDASLAFETLHMRSDGSTYPVQEHLKRIIIDGREHCVSVVTDLTEQKQSEETLRKSYEQQSILLRETNHRIKNNLNLVATLIEMQAGDVADAKMKSMLEANVARLQALMNLHDQLYLSRQTDRLDIRDYVQRLIDDLRRSFNAFDIDFEVNVSPFEMSSFAAINCGLILNELITNTVKYAFVNFPEEKKKRAGVRLTLAENALIELIVFDNGQGLQTNQSESGSFGMKLITMFARQLKADFVVDGSHGTQYRFCFEDNFISEV